MRKGNMVYASTQKLIRSKKQGHYPKQKTTTTKKIYVADSVTTSLGDQLSHR